VADYDDFIGVAFARDLDEVLCEAVDAMVSGRPPHVLDRSFEAVARCSQPQMDCRLYIRLDGPRDGSMRLPSSICSRELHPVLTF